MSTECQRMICCTTIMCLKTVETQEHRFHMHIGVLMCHEVQTCKFSAILYELSSTAQVLCVVFLLLFSSFSFRYFWVCFTCLVLQEPRETFK